MATVENQSMNQRNTTGILHRRAIGCNSSLDIRQVKSRMALLPIDINEQEYSTSVVANPKHLSVLAKVEASFSTKHVGKAGLNDRAVVLWRHYLVSSMVKVNGTKSLL